MGISVSILGTVEYKSGSSLQKKLVELRQQGGVQDIMVLLEHPPTLTFGKRENYNNIIVSIEELERMGVDLCKSNRGGDITYHGPGQVVGYPIIDLRNHGNSVKEYVNKLEQVFINLLNEEYQLAATRVDKYRGVWLGDEKIVAIGCSVKRGVTMHGFAFNVNTNLGHYKLINPCGITDKGVTSLEKITGKQYDMQVVNELVIKHFCKVFNVKSEIIEPSELKRLVAYLDKEK
ncbi:lipoyl(octanoyl) transferase [Desulfitispora alkaliphila]|uniref:lipoyl(octanoyl) transferase LipB n=1 Tax=Desulfitispora alkaliphila TaxID=622674 RepID=UPI003D261DB5